MKQLHFSASGIIWYLRYQMPMLGTEVLASGMTLYNNHCNHCHVQIARETGGAIPDLGYMNESINENFEAIVLDGLFSQNRMPNFKKLLTSNDVSEIKNYILATANSKNEERTTGNRK